MKTQEQEQKQQQKQKQEQEKGQKNDIEHIQIQYNSQWKEIIRMDAYAKSSYNSIAKLL